MAKSVVRGVIDLTGVTRYSYTNSSIIDVSNFSSQGNFNLWSCITGDLGKSNSGVSIIWDGNFSAHSGTTYWIIPTGTSFIRSNSTATGGPNSNGVDSASFSPSIFPFIRIKARHNGSATTCTAKVNYALIFE